MVAETVGYETDAFIDAVRPGPVCLGRFVARRDCSALSIITRSILKEKKGGRSAGIYTL